MIKVPATPAGIPAIEQLIGEGININITMPINLRIVSYLLGSNDLPIDKSCKHYRRVTLRQSLCENRATASSRTEGEFDEIREVQGCSRTQQIRFIVGLSGSV